MVNDMIFFLIRESFCILIQCCFMVMAFASDQFCGLHIIFLIIMIKHLLAVWLNVPPSFSHGCICLALQVSGLKSITSKHLALASQVISFIYAIMPGIFNMVPVKNSF